MVKKLASRKSTDSGVSLDALDTKLLSLVQEDASQSSGALGEKIGLSATAVQRRIRSLRSRKIVGPPIMVIAPEQIGVGLTAIISVVMRSEGEISLKAFQRAMLARREVAQCYYTAGSADFIVIASFPDIAGYEKFATTCFSANKNVRRYSTQIVLQTIKRTLTVPL